MTDNAELIARARGYLESWMPAAEPAGRIRELIIALEAADQERKDAVRRDRERCCATLTRMKKFADESSNSYHDARAFERAYDAIRALPNEEK